MADGDDATTKAKLKTALAGAANIGAGQGANAVETYHHHVVHSGPVMAAAGTNALAAVAAGGLDAAVNDVLAQLDARYAAKV